MASLLVWIPFFLSTVFGAPLTTADPVTIGKTFLAGSLDPTAGSTAWSLTSHGIAEKLFTVDKEGEIVGQVAETVTKIDALTWEVTLKANYKFSDGTAVTAEKVAAALTQSNTVNDNAKASVGTMTTTVVNDLKLKIATERATPVMDAVLAEWVFAVYYVNLGNYTFTGPYAVQNFVAGDRIELTPNTHYPQASERPQLTIKKYSTGTAVAGALEAGELDMGFHLPVTMLSELRKQDSLTMKSFEVGYHYMMWHNMRRSPLSDLRVRQAVDKAIDRVALSQELRGGKATRSLFPDYTPYFVDESDAHGDKTGAADLLDEAGWTMNSTSNKRMKNGAPLTLDLVAYPQRPGLVIMHPLIEQALINLGITVNGTITSGDNWNQLDQIMAAKEFDLLMWAQNTLPAGDPQWFLNNFFRSTSGSNHAGLSSTSVDGLIDALADTTTHAQRVQASAAAQAGVLAQVPVSNLVTPSWHVGLSRRLSTYEPWGSDYYVVRADLFVAPETTTPMEGGSEVSGARGLCLGGLFTTFLVASLL